MAQNIVQSICVYRDGGEFVAMGEVDRQILFRSTLAEQTIQRAVDAMTGGGEVRVERGDFPLHAPLRLASNVALRGRGRGTRLIATNGAGIVGSKIDGACVSALSIIASQNTAGQSGIALDACGDCRVVDAFVSGFGDFGVRLGDSSFLCEVRSCQLAGNAKAGIFLDHLARGRVGDFVPNSIANTSIYGGGEGILADHSIVVNIVGCSFFQTNGAAIHLTNQSNSVLVSGCRTFQIEGSPIIAETTHELNVTGNIFCWHTQDGIVARKCRWGAISGNEIIDNGSFNPDAPNETVRFDQLPSPPPKCGIVLEETWGYNVTGNTIFNWPQASKMRAGVAEDERCFRNVISSNVINYFREADMISRGRESVCANNVSRGDEPYVGKSSQPNAQSFQRRRLEEFIAAQLRNGGEGGPLPGKAQ